MVMIPSFFRKLEMCTSIHADEKGIGDSNKSVRGI